MTEGPGWSGTSRSVTPSRAAPARPESAPANLADILERVLDKGIVIAGDIRINLLDIELLTIKIRLLVASVDKAREIGIDWWEHDPTLSSKARDVVEENRRLRERIGELEASRHSAAAEVGPGERRQREPEEERPRTARPEPRGDEEP